MLLPRKKALDMRQFPVIKAAYVSGLTTLPVVKDCPGIQMKHATQGSYNMRYGVILALLSFVTFLGSVPLHAQVNTGTILGRITDPDGAAIVDVTVTATNQDTGFSRSSVTSANGSYMIPLLPIGSHYSVTATGRGFRVSQQSGITLQLEQNVRVDLKLQVGQVTEKVEVTDKPALVDTHSATVGEVVGSQRLEDLVLNGRNPLQLAGLVPGVASLVTKPVLNDGNRDANYMSVNGSRLNETDFQLNGVRFAGSYSNSGLNYPDPDALSEFKLITNPLDAEFGQYSGGVFTAVMKSGTNQFHGDAFEFVRNDILNAKNYFASTVPVLRQNQFGATAGGRIIKNRLFWFGSYQGFRIRQEALNASNPLTSEELQGLITSATPVIDPQTGQPFPQDSQGRYVIPQTRFSPVSQTLIQKFIPPAPAGGVLQSTQSSASNVNQYSGKIDFTLSRSDQVYVSGMYDLTSLNPAFSMGSFASYGNIPKTQNIHVISVSHVHVFRPTIINEFRFGYSSQMEQNTGTGQISPADLGMNNWNYNYLTDTNPQSPTFAVSGRFTLGSGGLGKWREGGRNFQFTDILSIVKGNHSLKVGGELYHRQHLLDANIGDTGYFIFAGLFTGGSPIAEFLLGEPSIDLKVRYLNHPGYKAWTDALFVQDNWKVLKRLTLNLGLRYELYNPFKEYRAQNEGPDHWEQHGHLFLPGEATIEPGVQSTVLPLAPLGLVYVGDKTPEYPNGIPPGIIALDKLQIQPRIGLAWDPFGDGKTAVRASAGLFSNAQYVDMQAQNSQDLPWVVVQQAILPPGYLTDPYAGQMPFPPPTSNNLKTDPNFFTPFLPAFGYGWSPNYVMPRITSLSFNVQRQVMSNLMIDVGYFGKLARHLQVGQDINSAQYLPGIVPTVANEPQRRPINSDAFQSIWMQQSLGTASYNALQASVRYQYHNGLTLLSSYTWSHSIDICSQYAAGGSCFQNPNNIAADRASSDFDQRHVYSFSAIYNIPDPFAGHGPMSRILGGWEVSGIVTARSGLPFNVATGYDASLTAAGGDRPDLVGNPYFSGSRSRAEEIAAYINPKAFAANTGHFGDLGRNAFTAPGYFNSDLGLFKNIPLGESRSLQFRSEFFNAFNQTHLNAPVATLVSPAFGQITSAGDPRLIQFGLKLFW
jgi:hypothetical protein